MTATPLIAVDIGNSTTKIGWDFQIPRGETLPTPREIRSFPTGQQPPDDLAVSLPNLPCLWHVSSVHRDGTRILGNWGDAQRPGDSVRLTLHVPEGATTPASLGQGADERPLSLGFTDLRLEPVEAGR